jgi:ankyrin repeat protein
MTLMQLAVHCKQPGSAEWLAQHGVTYSVLDAWDLGWKDKAAGLLKANPELVNHQYGEWNTTLLHTAAERDDIALARLALQAKPDLTLKDSIHDGTALGWAQYLQRKEIVKLIQEHQNL